MESGDHSARHLLQPTLWQALERGLIERLLKRLLSAISKCKTRKFEVALHANIETTDGEGVQRARRYTMVGSQLFNQRLQMLRLCLFDRLIAEQRQMGN